MSDNELNRIAVWNIPREDPGYIYLIRDNSRFKLGKSVDRYARIKAAGTWLPEMDVIGVKPFWLVSKFEKLLHEGLAPFWFDKEWFSFEADPYQEDFIDNFVAFSDEDADRDSNSINFLQWINEFSEIYAERGSRKQNLREFQRQISASKRSSKPSKRS